MESAKPKFAKWVFLIAGVTGIIELLPLFFMEKRLAEADPPAITHPEWYYGFVGLATVFQIVFLILSRDPQRYRPIMIPAILEKASYVLVTAWLFAVGRLSTNMLAGPAIDAIWIVLFTLAYLRTRDVLPSKNTL